ncbi:hypothetical protein ACKFKG_13765 [Phormidesmis sp. 146-35]
MKRSWILSVSAIVGVFAAVTHSLPTSAQTQSVTNPTPSVGLRFGGRSPLNQANFVMTEYFGDCQSTVISELEASFISEKTPPAPHRRVIIRNVTQGVSANPYPYTDREYDERRPTSETARASLGNTHDRRRFNLVEGNNEFQYEIKERNRVIDSGKFSAQVLKRLERVQSDAKWEQKKICKNSSVSLNECADIRKVREFKCRDGRVLQSIMEPDDRETYTRISNHTSSVIAFTVDGDSEVLNPGDSRRFSSNSSFGLKVRFNSTCADCDPTTSTTLTIGKRYVFRRSGSGTERVFKLVSGGSD